MKKISTQAVTADSTRNPKWTEVCKENSSSKEGQPLNMDGLPYGDFLLVEVSKSQVVAARKEGNFMQFNTYRLDGLRDVSYVQLDAVRNAAKLIK